MKAVVFGVHGFAGSAITDELLRRGHEVVGVTRTESDRVAPDGVDVLVGSVYDPAGWGAAIGEADWLVIAVQALSGSGTTLVDAVPGLAEAARLRGARLAFVGGSGGLLAPVGDSLVLDEPWFPAAIRATSLAHVEVYDALRAADGIDWFQICPSGRFGAQFPGERTGAYRVGDDRMLVPEQGDPGISGADFGIAVVDELERPAHRNRRFTVGY